MAVTLHSNGPKDNPIHTLQVALITDYKPRASTCGPKMRSYYKQCSTLVVGNNQFDFYHCATKKHQNTNTLSLFPVTEKGESRTVFDRETELIHRIQLRNVPVAAATKNDIVLSHVVELIKIGCEAHNQTKTCSTLSISNKLTIEY